MSKDKINAASLSSGNVFFTLTFVEEGTRYK